MFSLCTWGEKSSENNIVAVRFELQKSQVEVYFEVNTKSVYTSDEFSKEHWDNWGLWDFDVVEVFLKRSKEETEYLELQVSPLGQKFALHIKSPRKEYASCKLHNTKVEVTKLGQGFSAKFLIDLIDIPGEGGEIYGNCCACLGPKEERRYFTLFELGGGDLDFHRPEHFERFTL